MSKYYSPFRYPGGKRKLANYVKLLYRTNNLLDGEYAEPYAGGAAVALGLLYGEYVRRIYINDIDRSIYAFWDAALLKTNELCRLIRNVPVTMKEWERQKAVQEADDPDPLELALSTFFLNRTNRSGIISGGVIGGKQQSGRWKIDARFNKSDLIKRIRKIGRYSSRIRLYNLDAEEFIKSVIPTLQPHSLIYFDPPYFIKGQQKLYTNFYSETDHKHIATLISKLKYPWIISYDNVDAIRTLYQHYRSVSYGISYSAQARYQGKEALFFSDQLVMPEVDDPVRVRPKDLYQPNRIESYKLRVTLVRNSSTLSNPSVQ